MLVEVKVAEEYNNNGYLIYADNFPGAYVRGRYEEEALGKLKNEIFQYLSWRDDSLAEIDINIIVVDRKKSELNVEDADSDIIFTSEKEPLTQEEYLTLKKFALKSAADFQSLYDSIPDKANSILPVRKTFYGLIPRTAEEMYLHTKNVNSYYFGEIGIEVDNEPDIFACRKEGFEKLETYVNYLSNEVKSGSYNEEWSLRKLLRRFIWHDRIHAKAMYRMACKLYGKENAVNPFRFMV
ncbi:hypothetical protein [Anaerocolumna xylanovorans]|uniref:Uncharacterized protein n=1 Tax=Anaerocolumna xylanovorans DSM 12503 TaxID=1121345 RepID=A0A1M7YFW5_9FIRM|nr:hypothetical protein [Anaerocolumna xylanovorans]SHO51547.1 hypothetical protein SAMN02745217_03249 [Anaerocolumna xylanovorans DSM 12503]